VPHETHERTEGLLERFYAADAPTAEALAGELVASVLPQARACLASAGARGDDLEDLCQNTQIRLLNALRASHAPGGERIENVVAFVRAIARNLVISDVRSAQSRPRLDSVEDLTARTEGHPDGVLPPAPADIEAEVLAQEWFRTQVWPQVCELRPQQRAALLLGMRQDELLLLAGKISTVAKVLDIPPGEFLGFWRGLPLSDREIGARLGILPEGKTTVEGRVSNLRKCALERLARHVSRTEEHGSGKESGRIASKPPGRL
jgi:DNA-directed RNA polymerase specialized sigma24 family protein